MNPRITLDSDEAAQRLASIMKETAKDFDGRFLYIWGEFRRPWRDLPPETRSYLAEVTRRYHREIEPHIEGV